MSTALPSWIALLPAGVALALMPGPNNLLSVQVAVTCGARSACRAGLGRLGAFALLLGACALGLAAALRHLPWLPALVQTAASLYLLVLAARGWGAGGRRPPAGSTVPEPAQALRREFWVALGNPKCLLIATAFVPQFAQAGEPVLPRLVLGSAVVLALEALAVLAYAFGGGLLQRWLQAPSAASRFARMCSLLMAAAALWLLWRTWS